ncbi:hypothetical protein QUB80_32560 [Chlorogloeopsis sp. ULAP01]|uniref:hypothetical protein n=1 Tax=Chlorogloeopsis sp. ULAP01 TaxID=3056483 RepID=UPI0025AA57A2|nr:hypothetical protein [Chlorogloeopsis sp. ULAP01]MDM9385388.1 hypothetical protein [Chlorogloeopsis sp. ULAP01]
MVAAEHNRQLTSRWGGEPNLFCFFSMILVAAQLGRYREFTKTVLQMNDRSST